MDKLEELNEILSTWYQEWSGPTLDELLKFEAIRRIRATPQNQTIETGNALRQALTDAGELREELDLTQKTLRETCQREIKLAHAVKVLATEREELRELLREIIEGNTLVGEWDLEARARTLLGMKELE